MSNCIESVSELTKKVYSENLELKKQLKEANNVVLLCHGFFNNGWNIDLDAPKRYLEKYGVVSE